MTYAFQFSDTLLWDTDAVYANAQLALLARVEEALGISAWGKDRLNFIRAVELTLFDVWRWFLKLLMICLKWNRSSSGGLFNM